MASISNPAANSVMYPEAVYSTKDFLSKDGSGFSEPAANSVIHPEAAYSTKDFFLEDGSGFSEPAANSVIHPEAAYSTKDFFLEDGSGFSEPAANSVIHPEAAYSTKDFFLEDESDSSEAPLIAPYHTHPAVAAFFANPEGFIKDQQAAMQAKADSDSAAFKERVQIAIDKHVSTLPPKLQTEMMAKLTSMNAEIASTGGQFSPPDEEACCRIL